MTMVDGNVLVYGNDVWQWCMTMMYYNGVWCMAMVYGVWQWYIRLFLIVGILGHLAPKFTILEKLFTILEKLMILLSNYGNLHAKISPFGEFCEFAYLVVSLHYQMLCICCGFAFIASTIMMIASNLPKILKNKLGFHQICQHSLGCHQICSESSRNPMHFMNFANLLSGFHKIW